MLLTMLWGNDNENDPERLGNNQTFSHESLVRLIHFSESVCILGAAESVPFFPLSSYIF